MYFCVCLYVFVYLLVSLLITWIVGPFLMFLLSILFLQPEPNFVQKLFFINRHYLLFIMCLSIEYSSLISE